MNKPHWISAFLSALLIIMIASTAVAKPHQAIDSVDALDKQISVSLELLAEGNILAAQLLTRQMAWRFPDFALGQLIHAELESVSAFQDVRISDHLPIARNVSELLLEAKRRLAAARVEATNDQSTQIIQENLPGNVIQIGEHLSQLLVVDLQTSVLYHYETANQQSVLVRQHYVGSGEAGFGKRLEGDLKTPLGVYTITGFRSDSSLPDLYGSGALTLDYPNTLDQYLGRTGYGIWLHGVPSNQRSRTPYSSEGCVTMSNEHMSRLSSDINASNARVILTNDATPLDNKARGVLQKLFRQRFAEYQRAWISGEEKQLLSLYSDPNQLLDMLASGKNGLMRVNAQAGNKPDGIEHNFARSMYQQAFSAIRPEHLSIFSHPDVIGDGETITAGMITNAIFGEENEYQITTYWTEGTDGQWRVLTETVEGIGL